MKKTEVALTLKCIGVDRINLPWRIFMTRDNNAMSERGHKIDPINRGKVRLKSKDFFRET